MNKLASGREKYPKFIYEKFAWELRNNTLRLTFNYSIPPDINFVHRLTINNLPINSRSLTINLDILVFHLGLIEAFSYWKSTCSPNIIIKAGYLNRDQIGWWQKLLIRGMGEFFYKNKLNFTVSNFVNWQPVTAPRLNPFPMKTTNKYILLFGRGKDSFVALEILKRAQKNFIPLWVNPSADRAAVASSCGLKSFVEVKRRFDPKLLELNKRGYFNGHVPFSASLAFLSLLIASVSGVKYITVANEKSANEENTVYLGKKINHQYSKTFEFEKDFNDYVKKYITPDILYFSLVRPLYELQVAKIFSRFPKYFRVFNSCNRFAKVGGWCGRCPKCLSVFLLLSPFVGVEKTTAIFKKDLLNDKTLLPLFNQLIGKGFPKPFECVATSEEAKVASYLVYRRCRHTGRPLPYLIADFVEPLPRQNYYSIMTNKILKNFDKNHLIPEDLAKALKPSVKI